MEGGTIRLGVKIFDNKMHFEVSDTGVGLNGYSQKNIFGKGIGLRNTRLRLMKLYGEEMIIGANRPEGNKSQFFHTIFKVP